MNRWSKLCTLLGGVILLGAVFGFGFYEINRRNQTNIQSVEHAEPEDSFSRYSFVSQHDDGSSVTVFVYQYDGNVYLSEAYKDAGNQWGYQHKKFDSKQAENWYETVMNPTMADNNHALESSYETADLFFSTETGDMSYGVAPFDLSEFGYVDPWKDEIKTVGDLPDYCGVFESDAIRALLGFDGNARENAYMQSLYQQIARILYPDEPGFMDLAEYSFESIALDSVTDTGYVLKLSSKDGDYSFLVTMEGYVLGQK